VTDRLYVYGVVHADGAPLELPEGVGGAQVFLHTRDELGAIVSAVADDARLGRAADARAHESVLRAALDARDPVLPVRFGSIYADAEQLEAELLAPAAAQLEQLLEALAGTVELELRALYPDQERILRDLVRDDPGLARLRERVRRSPEFHARIQLGEATLEAFERRRAGDAELLRQRVAPFVRDQRERSELPERVAAHLALLVEREHVGDVEREAERLAEEVHERLVLRLVGPLPPYSFVAVELEPAGAR
jgi:hypothetical protein